MKALVVAIFLFIITAGSAFAKEDAPELAMCAPDLLEQFLAGGEEVIFSGVSGSGGYHIVIVADPDGKWVILVTPPGDNVTCLYDYGTGAISLPMGQES